MNNEENRVPVRMPERLRPQNNENKTCECMNREYLMTYKQGLMHWLKAPGDPVEQGETVCEAEVEKKIFEVAAPVSGILAECCVEEEADFACNEILGYIAVR